MNRQRLAEAGRRQDPAGGGIAPGKPPGVVPGEQETRFAGDRALLASPAESFLM